MPRVQISVDYQHVLILVFSAMAGAALGYLVQQDPVALLSSFDSWPHARPIVLGFIYAELVALLALVKKSPIEKTPDDKPPVPGKVEFLRRSAPPPPLISVMPSSFPKTPRTMLAIGLIAAALSLTTAGCGAWWAEFKNNPGQVAAQFVAYVESFIQAASTVWAMVVPLLGSGGPGATVLFNDAMVGLHNALGVFLDAVNAAVNAKTANPDFSKLIAAVQDAVARVMAVIAQFKSATPTPALGAGHDFLVHQATEIGAWRK